MSSKSLLLALSLLFILPLSLNLAHGQTVTTINVVTSTRPIALLVQELTTGLKGNSPITISVSTLLPQGATPHDYALKPSDLKAVAGADLVVWLGPHSEPYLRTVVNKSKRSIDWSALEDLRRLAPRRALHEDHDDHDDHHDHHEHNADFDLHFWFSADNASALLMELEKSLSGLAPELKAPLTERRIAIQYTLQQQRQLAQADLKSTAGAFLLSHDAYHYLEEDLGVHSDGAISLDPEIKPGVKHLLAIKSRIKNHGVRCVVTDPSISSALLDKVDTNPPLFRVSIDPLAWDYQGMEYSQWLASVYKKTVACVTAP